MHGREVMCDCSWLALLRVSCQILRHLEEGDKIDSTSVAATGVVAEDNVAFDNITKMDVTQFVQHAITVRGAGLFLHNVM